MPLWQLLTHSALVVSKAPVSALARFAYVDTAQVKCTYERQGVERHTRPACHGYECMNELVQHFTSCGSSDTCAELLQGQSMDSDEQLARQLQAQLNAEAVEEARAQQRRNAGPDMGEPMAPHRQSDAGGRRGRSGRRGGRGRGRRQQ